METVSNFTIYYSTYLSLSVVTGSIGGWWSFDDLTTTCAGALVSITSSTISYDGYITIKFEAGTSYFY